MDILGIGNAMTDVFLFEDTPLLPETERSGAAVLPPPLVLGGAAHLDAAGMDDLLDSLIPGYSPGQARTAYPGFTAAASSGGTAANVLKALAAFGFDVLFAGTTGSTPSPDGSQRDDWALFFQKSLAEAGVQARLTTAEDTSGRCLIVHTKSGESAIAASPAAARNIAPSQIPDDFFTSRSDANGVAPRPVLAVLEGTVLSNEPVVEKLTRLCAEHDIPLALDIATPFMAKETARLLPVLAAQTKLILFANEFEAEQLIRAAIHTERLPDVENIKRKFFASLTKQDGGFPIVVEKLGPRGARCWKNGTMYFAEAEEERTVLDATGAGDTFAGAFLAAWLKDFNVPFALSFANAAARLALTVPGTSIPREKLIRTAKEYGII